MSDTKNSPVSSNDLLTTILKNVSRAFYLSMRVLPDGVRQPISLGYLLARAADTLADTPNLGVEVRLERLNCLRQWVSVLQPENAQQSKIATTWSAGATAGEQKLLEVLPQALQLTALLQDDDRAAVQKVVDTLISGMVHDLTVFPGRFTEIAELDEYTYLVAGCVGEFWSDIIARHTKALRHWDKTYWSAQGIRFGKALQLTNVLRDAVKDLENGRSYIPGLVREGWIEAAQTDGHNYYDEVKNFLNINQQDDILRQWIEVALKHYRCAIAYALSMPWHCWRLRLAVIWPIAIGLATLAKLSVCPTWLQRGCRVKVSRNWVYCMLAITAPLSLCTPALRYGLNYLWDKTAHC